jgi:hypothetical protein
LGHSQKLVWRFRMSMSGFSEAAKTIGYGEKYSLKVFLLRLNFRNAQFIILPIVAQ